MAHEDPHGNGDGSSSDRPRPPGLRDQLKAAFGKSRHDSRSPDTSTYNKPIPSVPKDPRDAPKSSVAETQRSEGSHLPQDPRQIPAEPIDVLAESPTQTDNQLTRWMASVHQRSFTWPMAFRVGWWLLLLPVAIACWATGIQSRPLRLATWGLLALVTLIAAVSDPEESETVATLNSTTTTAEATAAITTEAKTTTTEATAATTTEATTTTTTFDYVPQLDSLRDEIRDDADRVNAIELSGGELLIDVFVTHPGVDAAGVFSDETSDILQDLSKSDIDYSKVQLIVRSDVRSLGGVVREIEVLDGTWTRSAIDGRAWSEASRATLIEQDSSRIELHDPGFRLGWEFGSTANPWPYGEAVRLTYGDGFTGPAEASEWEISVAPPEDRTTLYSEVSFGGNGTPAPGFVWMFWDIETRLVAASDGDAALPGTSFYAIGPATRRRYEDSCLGTFWWQPSNETRKLDTDAQLYDGGAVSGWKCFEVALEDLEVGVQFGIEQWSGGSAEVIFGSGDASQGGD
jgi:hypothetical protein